MSDSQVLSEEELAKIEARLNAAVEAPARHEWTHAHRGIMGDLRKTLATIRHLQGENERLSGQVTALDRIGRAVFLAEMAIQRAIDGAGPEEGDARKLQAVLDALDEKPIEATMQQADEIERLQAELQQVSAERDRLLEILDMWGGHMWTCGVVNILKPSPCGCGWGPIEAELKAMAASTEQAASDKAATQGVSGETLP